MRRLLLLCVVAATTILLTSTPSWANEPVKWSAPMNHYPNQWVPTAEPPRYYNPYGYRNPYYGYGYGYGYGSQYDHYGYGSWGRAAAGQRYQTDPQQGYSGNPYNNYYYGR